jgi:AraC-like DNA-binding protein
MSSLLHTETYSSIRAALDGLGGGEAFGNVHVANETGPLSAGVYSAMRTSPQLIFCVDGEVTYWVRRQGVPTQLTARAGDAIVLPGGVWVSVDPKQHYRTFGVSLFPEMVHCYLVQPGRAGEPHPGGGKSRSFDELKDNTVRAEKAVEASPFERIDYIDELDRPSAPDQTLEQLITTLAINADRSSADPLLNHLLKAAVLRVRETVNSTQQPASSKAEATYERIRRFVIANCDQPLDRDQIATAAGVHPRHVSNLFNRFSDETLSQFVLRARLERARRLLAVSDSSVTEISEICGFAGANHFVRAFRQRFGAPPGMFRSATTRFNDRAS